MTLHPGDVLWWDYRRWSGAAMSVPVVVGAYPEPFLHGFPGKTSVVGADHALAARIAAQVHGVVNAKATPRNYIVIGGKLPPRDSAHRAVPQRSSCSSSAPRPPNGSPRNPHALRYRY